MQRASNLVIAFSPTFKRQLAFGNALELTDLTATFPATSKNYPEVNETIEVVKDCSGQRTIDELVTARIGQMTIDFDATPQLLAGFLALAKGTAAFTGASAPYTHTITQMGLDVFQPPQTTLVVGFRNSVRAPVVLKDVVVKSVRVSIKARGKVTVSVELRFSGNLASAAGFVMPACATIAPVRASDCTLVIGATDHTANLREAEYTFDLNLLTSDDPFTANSIDATRIERADEIAESFSFSVVGEPGDALHADAVARSRRAVLLTIGTASNRAVVDCDEAILKRNGSGVGFDGEANRSVIRVTALPVAISADAPTSVVATNSQATAYLVAGA